MQNAVENLNHLTGLTKVVKEYIWDEVSKRSIRTLC